MREQGTGSPKNADEIESSIALRRDLSFSRICGEQAIASHMVWPWISNDKKELGTNQQIIWCGLPVVDSQRHGAGGSEALHSSSCPILGAALEMPPKRAVFCHRFQG
jgi:hypothetical protein